MDFLQGSSSSFLVQSSWGHTEKRAACVFIYVPYTQEGTKRKLASPFITLFPLYGARQVQSLSLSLNRSSWKERGRERWREESIPLFCTECRIMQVGMDGQFFFFSFLGELCTLKTSGPMVAMELSLMFSCSKSGMDWRAPSSILVKRLEDTSKLLSRIKPLSMPCVGETKKKLLNFGSRRALLARVLLF